MCLGCAMGTSVRPKRGTPLTERELEIVEMVIDGFTNLNIAAKRGVSENAVKASLYRIFAKCGVGSRRELASEHMKDRLGRLLDAEDESLMQGERIADLEIRLAMAEARISVDVRMLRHVRRGSLQGATQ